VFRSAGRRLVEATVGLFALLGFLYVPLGRHTGFEHARAVLGTPAAAEAIEDLTTAALELRQRALELVTGRMPPPTPAGDDVRKKKAAVEPRPVPPKLD
jgi:hypothetical protein